MKMEQISIIVFIVAIAYLYYSKPQNTLDMAQSEQQIQNSAPWFLLYNYPVGLRGQNEPALPSGSAGQANVQDDRSCAVCSLFPNYNTSQY